MSTTTSARKMKERGVEKIKPLVPLRTQTPISERPNLGSGRKSGVIGGKEKSASRVSGQAQKPNIRPMPRMSSSVDVDPPRPRSRPRGRSPSPSDFSKMLSDLRKVRVGSGENESEAVGSGRFSGSGRKVGRELSQRNVGRVSVDGKENGFVGGSGSKFRDETVSSGRKKEGLVGCVDHQLGSKVGKFSSVGSVEKNVENGIVVGSKFRDSGGRKKEGNLSDHGNKDGNLSSVGSGVDKVVNVDVKMSGSGNVKAGMERNGSELSSKGLGVKSVSSLKGSDEKGVVKEDGSSGRNSSKKASKLHEKLAYLEGKVKRIATDIKKTKEMLDMNNTDASKMILSDIQEKISGIEKAMGSVMADSGGHLTGVISSGNGEMDNVRMTVNGVGHDDSTNVSVKGLSSEELEERLFPHHRLLRDRTLKVSSMDSQKEGIQVLDTNSGSNPEEDSLSPIDQNPIALEFLASLNKVQSEVVASDAGVTQDVDVVKETEDSETSTARQSSEKVAGKQSTELNLQADESLDEFDSQEIKPAMIVEDDMEDDDVSQLMEIGRKTSTGGWFVSEGESVLLAHGDGSCSFHDIANREEKAEYRPPTGAPQNLWRDCWLIRAPGADGCAGKYVVAASAGNTMDSGFCSWDFYSKEVKAFHIEDNKTTKSSTRVALGPLPDNISHRRNALSAIMSSENQQWWYAPCGPLIISGASCQKAVKVYDIRDGEQIMKWDVQRSVLSMDYSSPLQWRNRGKAVIAEAEGISVWDVSSLNSQALMSISTSGRRISALHVNNTDAELGGGVRQRVSSSEAEGNDGVFCTADSINILDFRHPSGIGLKIPKIGVCVQSVSSRGDSVFLGCSTLTSAAKKQVSSQVLQFSLRKQKIVNTYALPESSAHSHHKALTQVWGNSNLVMAVCGLGLFVFDALRDDGLPSYAVDYSSPQMHRDVIGPDDLYSPSFDYASSQALLISRDRPAMWRFLS